MKKTMFITSVIMVVVMAIALTTSSLAWFSAAGNSVVTTTALTINAQATASTGIMLGRTSTGAWSNTIHLADTYVGGGAVDDDEFGGMKPLMPLAGAGSVSVALAKAALGEGNTGSVGFIGQLKGTNAAFAYDAAENAITPYTDGYYVDDSIYVTNMASGTGAKAVYIVPTVTFKTTAGEAYTADSRDPDLFVAVLADTDDDDNTATWEVVNVFHSNTTDTSGKLAVGKVAEDFASGQTISAAYDKTTVALSAMVAVASDNGSTGAKAGGTSTPVAAIAEGAAFGAPKNFKVVAWYAGDTLDNNNSNFGLKIEITFTAYNAVA